MSLAVTEGLGDGRRSFDATAQAVVYTLLSWETTPNKLIIIEKIDASANAVSVDAPSGYLFSNGGSSIVLTGGANFFTVIKKPDRIGLPALIIAGVGTGGTAPLPIYNVDQSITGATTFAAGTSPMPAVVQGALLGCRMVQDATGHAASYGSGFKAAPVIDPTALMVSVALFLGGADGNWWSVGLGIVGVHP